MISRLAGCIGLAALTACTSPTPPPPPDLLLITLDTTRADALGAYGASPSPTPHLDALARQGLRAEEAMSVTPLTLPAHTSMLSGIYPDVHRVRDNGLRLPEGLPLLAERLSEGGYATAAVVASVVLDGSTGLSRGFDVYADGFDLSRLEGVHHPGATRTATQVTDRAGEVLGALDPGRPRFLWLHFYDPHQPLRPPDRHRAAHDDPYLAEVAYMDAEIGAFLETFPDRERPWAALVVADHGEGRGDHGEATHGQSVYRSTMAVPLILAGSRVEPGVLPGPVSIADVAPTLLDLAGQPVPQGLDGRSLLGSMPQERVVYGESYHQRYALGLSELHVWQDASSRYIEAPRPELYRWPDDPAEAFDLADPDLRGAWTARIDVWRSSRPGPLSAGASDPDRARALAALGYVTGADPDPDAALPDPKDHPDLQARVDALIVLARTRPPAEAVPLLRAFVAEHPRVRVARQLLVRALQLSGQPEEALAIAGQLLQETPLDAGLRAQAAELCLTRGQVEAAREHLVVARQQAPDQPVVAALEGELARREGRCAAVLPRLDAVLQAQPEASRTRLVRGACRHDTGALEGARADLLRVRREDPENPDVHYLLGITLLALGQVEQSLEPLRVQLRRSPNAALVHEAIGLALLRLGRAPQALPHLRRAAEPPGAGVPVRLALAEALLATEAPDAEIAPVLQALPASEPAVQRVQAARLMRLGRTEEALDLMVRARRAQERRLRAPTTP